MRLQGLVKGHREPGYAEIRPYQGDVGGLDNMEVARVRVRDRSEVTPGGPERSPLGGFNSALDALLASLQLAAGHGLDDDIALLLLRPELKPGNPPRSP